MMSLKEKIQSDFKRALKEGAETEIQTLRLLNAALLSQEKEKRRKIGQKEPGLSEKELEAKSELGEEEILEVLISEAKKRREAILAFEKGGREDLAEKEKAELKILEQYLPEQLSQEELERIIKDVIKEVKAKSPQDMGKVMAALMPKIKGRADARQAAQLVKEILGQK